MTHFNCGCESSRRNRVIDFHVRCTLHERERALPSFSLTKREINASLEFPKEIAYMAQRLGVYKPRIKTGNIRFSINEPVGTINDLIIKNHYNLTKKLIGKTVLDCGANAGVVSLYAASLGANVIAIEPDRKIFKKLLENIALNPSFVDKIVPVNKAVSDHAGKATLEDNTLEKERRTEGIKEEVELITIDELVRNEEIEFIKMDIEGHEKSALRGGMKTIQRCKPTISLAAYHLPDDISAIPRLITEIDKDYCFSISFEDEVNIIAKNKKRE